MLDQLLTIYRSVKAAKAQSDALVEEGRLITGWYGTRKKRPARRPMPPWKSSPI
jgi:hypothetical protein